LFAQEQARLSSLHNSFGHSGRTILNALDGMVAKDTGLARPWGEVLNEFSDRLATSLCLVLDLLASVQPAADVRFLISVVLSSYLGILAKAAGGSRNMAASWKSRSYGSACSCRTACFILAVTGVCQPNVVFDVLL